MSGFEFRANLGTGTALRQARCALTWKSGNSTPRFKEIRVSADGATAIPRTEGAHAALRHAELRLMALAQRRAAAATASMLVCVKCAGSGTGRFALKSLACVREERFVLFGSRDHKCPELHSTSVPSWSKARGSLKRGSMGENSPPGDDEVPGILTE